MVLGRKDILLICHIYILSVSHTGANLILGGTPSDLERWAGSPIASVNDCNLGCASWYHAGGTLANDWVNVQSTQTVTVNTILYVAAEHYDPLSTRNVNLEFRVGTSVSPLANPVCHPGPIQKSGWYQCTTTLVGNQVSVNQLFTDYFHTLEILAYTEFTIQ